MTRTEPEKPDPRRSYSNAPWYEKACRVEYRAVRELLRCLGAQFAYAPPIGQGRPPVCYGDLLVVGGLAKYADDSSRFAINDPQMLIDGGYLQAAKPPKPSTLRDHMRTKEMQSMLRTAFDLTADVVRSLETEFVMDSTDVRTPNNEIVLQKIKNRDVIYQKARNLKFNIAAGVKTHVMTGVLLMGEHESDQRGLIPTLEQFWDRFRIDVVYGDPGYDDSDNFEAVAARGGVAMIKIRDFENRNPQGKPHYDAQLARMKADETGYLADYHVRSLAETVNSTLVRTVTSVLRCRFPECIVNEALMLCIVYNLIRLLHARYEFAVEIPWADERAMRVIDGLDDLKIA